MVFSSNVFLFCFLPCVLVLYFALYKFKNIVLLFSSLFFYMWGGASYLLLMLSSIILNYAFGLIINIADKKEKQLLKQCALVMAILCNLGILFYFKYLDFSISILNYILKSQIPLQNIVLPIGISFFTFQGISYIIDLYRKKVEVQKNLIKIALYISCFPQLIAGPIIRYRDINNEIESRFFSIEDFSQGIIRFISGLGKKVLIANTLGLTADSIFGLMSYKTQEVSTLWLGIVCYTLQIYFDFSGYSDMAIGLGQMFGFHFLENFNYPYISKSISEFWRRWHISLSSFFKDYLYIPLGGNRRGNVYINLFIVFLVTGIWHGASINFVLWGIWHGFFVIVERIISNTTNINKWKVSNILKHIYTIFIVMIGWVLFRADDLPRALEYVKGLFGCYSHENVHILTGWYVDKYTIFILMAAIICATPVPNKVSGFLQTRINLYVSEIAKLVLFFAFVIFLFMQVLTSTYNPFIYFRF